MGNESEAKTWAMVLHLSVFASYIIPLAGIVAPIVIWQVKKPRFPNWTPMGESLRIGLFPRTFTSRSALSWRLSSSVFR